MPVASQTNAADLAVLGVPIPTSAIFLAAICQVDERLIVELDDDVSAARTATVTLPNEYGVGLTASENEVWVFGFDPGAENLWVIFPAEDNDPDSRRITAGFDVEPEVLSRAEIARILPDRIRELRAHTA